LAAQAIGSLSLGFFKSEQAEDGLSASQPTSMPNAAATVNLERRTLNVERWTLDVGRWTLNVER
jgi:hypothetical protein